MPVLFLSHSGLDKAAAVALKQRLLASPDAQAEGLSVWLDIDDLDAGRPWQAQIETAIGGASAFAVIVGTNGIRNWVRAETDLALSRAAGDERFRIIPILQDGGSENLTPFVKRYHAVRNPLTDPDALKHLLQATLGWEGGGLPVLTDSPFPGLRSMTEDWADRFFGRRRETDDLLAMLRCHRAVTIVADSGAGKSSLAMAGVAHAWRGGALHENRPGADDPLIWHVITMRPAENPVEQLRDAIETAAVQMDHEPSAIASYRDRLVTDPAFALRCGLDPCRTRTLLIIDQAEELVTLAPRARRPEFSHLLAKLTEAMGDRLRILMTVRSDHLNLVTGIEGLGPLIAPFEARFNLKQPVNLAEIVCAPLALAGHTDEAEQRNLIDRLRQDLFERPGDLALAQMTLSLVWRDRDKNGGLMGAYAVNGGALAALGNEAARVERMLPADDAARLMPIFIRLIRLSEIDTTATRRIADRSEFDDSQNRLIDQLAGQDYGRLIQTGATQVEIAHEALITQWPRLHDYLIEHAPDLRTLSDLMRRAQDWEAAGKSAKHLTSLADEERFQTLRQLRGAWLAPIEQNFLDWSEDGHRRIQNEREAETKAKSEALVGRQRAVNRGIAAALVLLLVLIGVGRLAYERDQNARLQAEIAIDRDKAAQQAERQAQAEAVKASKSRADALALLGLSRAETRPIDALKLILATWPADGSGSWPTPSVAFRAISTALANTRPHLLLRGHEDLVISVAFSPDGHRIVSGGTDGMLRLWDADTGRALGEPLLGHEDSVTSVAFSPDGSSIVSGGTDGSLRLWDAAIGTPLGEPLRGHEGWILSVAFSPDGSRIVSGGSDATLRLWDADTGTPLGEPLRGHKDSVDSVAFSPDGSRIVSGGDNGTLRLWDADTGSALGELLRVHEGWVHSVAFSPDGHRIVSGATDGTLRLWDADTGSALGEPLLGHEDSVSSVAFSPDGSRIVSGGNDATLRLWDADTGRALGEPLLGHEDRVTSAFSPDGHRIVSGGNDATLRLWDAAIGTPLGEPLRGHEYGVRSVALSPDGRRIVSGGDDRTLRLWDADTGTPLGEPLRGHKERVTSVAFSPDGSRIVSGGDDGTLRLWDAAIGTPLGKPLRGHEGWVHSVAFSPDGRRIVSGGDDRTLRLWDAATGSALGEPLRGHEAGVTSVAFSPDGSRIVSGSQIVIGGRDGTLRLWDAATGSALGEPLRGYEDGVLSVAFSPDGSRIVSGDYDGRLRLWDAVTGTPLGEPLRGHDGWVRSVAFSPDGRRIVSGSDDGTLRLWDAVTGTPLGEPLRGHEGWVYSVAFSPDGRRIVSSSTDRTLRLWENLPAGNILQLACRYLPVVNGKPDSLTDGLAAEIGIDGLSLPTDCDSYDPPLPPEVLR